MIPQGDTFVTIGANAAMLKILSQIFDNEFAEYAPVHLFM